MSCRFFAVLPPACAFLALAGLAVPARANWPTGGVALSLASGAQTASLAAPDATGGAYVLWFDARSGSADLYAQHVNGSGDFPAGWPADGLGVCVLPSTPTSPVLCSDGVGGAYAAWSDPRAGTPDVYLARLASGGLASGWPADGLVVCNAVNSQVTPAVAPDGSGGAFVAWADTRGATTDIYVQHVLGNATVDPTWTANGIAVCSAVRSQTQVVMASDDAGGAILAWADGRNGSTLQPDQDVYALRITATGAPATGWTANGDPVCVQSTADQQAALLLPDGAGGAFFVWQDGRNGPRANQVKDLFAARLDGQGDLVSGWTANGTPVVQAVGDQLLPALASDGAGGLYVVWQDGRDTSTFPTNTDVYGARFTGSGALLTGWVSDGVDLTAQSPTREDDPSIAPDAAHGFFLAWEDTRAAGHVYLLRIAGDATRAAGWPTGGMELSATDGPQLDTALVPDGAGGVVMAWDDPRLGTTDRNVFAQRISANGQIGPTVGVPADDRASGIRLALRGSHPALAKAQFTLEVPDGTTYSASIYGPAGRRVWSSIGSPASGAGTQTLTWQGEDGGGRRAPPGVYWLRVAAGPQSATMRFVFLP